MDTALIAGVGMTRFAKSTRTLRDLAGEAVQAALDDAGLEVGAIEAAYVGNAVAGLVTGQEMIRGQVMLRPLGIEGIPIFNIENACASASSALHLALAGRRRRAPTTSCSASGRRSSRTRTRRVGMAAIGTAVDVEHAGRDGRRSSGRPRAAAARSFFMDIYAEMARDYMARLGRHGGGLRRGGRQEPAQRRAATRAPSTAAR